MLRSPDDSLSLTRVHRVHRNRFLRNSLVVAGEKKDFFRNVRFVPTFLDSPPASLSATPFTATASAMTSVNVQTRSGPITGYLDSHPLSDASTATLPLGSSLPVAKWLGVPHGRSTRWTNVVAPEAWTIPLETREFGSHFPQAPSGTDAIYGGGKAGVHKREWVQQSEDSHTVNVFAPGDMTPGEKLPVLVRLLFIDLASLSNGMRRC